MDNIDYFLILTAYVVASVIKGLTGVGFSTSCLPIMALRLDLKVAIPLVIVPSIISNVGIMIQAGSFSEAVRRFWTLYLSSIPGLLIGLVILVTIRGDAARVILGIVLASYALLALSNKPFILSRRWERKLKIPVGFCTGLINGLTGSQVLPVLPYLMSLDLKKNSFVQSINISFTLSSLIMLFTIDQLGFLAPKTFLIAVGSLVPVLPIVYFSGKLRQHLSVTWYRRLVLFFLLIMGVILSVKSIL